MTKEHHAKIAGSDVIKQLKERIGTNKRHQKSYDESLILPIPVIVTLARQYKPAPDEKPFNRSHFLEVIARNVNCWVLPTSTFDGLSKDKSVCINDLSSLTLDSFEQGYFMLLPNGYVKVVDANEQSFILYNPPLLTRTLRNIMGKEYSYRQTPVKATTLSGVQLDHEVSIACMLSAYCENKAYENLKTISSFMQKHDDVKKWNYKIVQKWFPNKLGSLQESAYKFLTSVEEEITTPNTGQSRLLAALFTMQLCDSDFNHSKTYRENTLLTSYVRKVNKI